MRSAPHLPSKTREYLLYLFLSFFWTWVWIVLESPTDLPVSLFNGGLSLPARSLCLLGFALSCLICIAGYRIAPDYFLSGQHRSGVFVATLISLLIAGFIEFSDTPYLVLGWQADLIEGILLGAVGGVLYIKCGTAVCAYGSRFVLMSCAIASVIAAPLGIGAIYLCYTIRQIIVLVFPLLSFFFLDFYLLRGEKPPGALKENDGFKMPWKFLLTVLLFSLALGNMQSIFAQSIPNKYIGAVSILGFALSSVIIAVSVFVRGMNFNCLIYQVGFPTMAAGFILVVLGNTTFVSYLLCISGYRFTEIVIWSLFSFLVARKKGSSVWLFALFGMLMSLGQTTGLLAGEGLFSDWIATASPVLIIILLLFGALYLVTSKSPYEIWGIVNPGNAKPDDTFEMACRLIANERTLTSRETDVLLLAARGHNRDSIAKLLFLSKDTIKTHMRNLYSKMDIHSQQELIVLIECRKKQIEGKHETMVNRPN